MCFGSGWRVTTSALQPRHVERQNLTMRMSMRGFPITVNRDLSKPSDKRKSYVVAAHLPKKAPFLAIEPC